MAICQADAPPVSLRGYALTHEEVERMIETTDKELMETRAELGIPERSHLWQS